jgi:hypothetical protein
MLMLPCALNVRLGAQVMEPEPSPAQELVAIAGMVLIGFGLIALAMMVLVEMPMSKLWIVTLSK